MSTTVGTEWGDTMEKYVIERALPGAGALGGEELRGVATKSNKVLAELGPEIQWLHSYVTDDKIYCVYAATSEDVILEHARCGGFPADSVQVVRTMIDPTTASAPVAG
jgi:hypothetical protein